MHHINLFSLIENNGIVELNYLNQDLKRLPQADNIIDNNIKLTLRGETIDQNGRTQNLIHINISGLFFLKCQRCENCIEKKIHITNTLEVFYTQSTLEKLPIEQENFDSIVGSKEYNPQELLEEEILLNLPAFPTHDVCPTHDYYAKTQEVESPFAILKKLKPN